MDRFIPGFISELPEIFEFVGFIFGVFLFLLILGVVLLTLISILFYVGDYLISLFTYKKGD